MAFCRNCGSALPENVKFCPGCGSAVEAAPAGDQIRQEAYIPHSWMEDGGSTANNTPNTYTGGGYQTGGTGSYQSSYTPPVDPGKKKKKFNPAILVFGALFVVLIILIVTLVGGGSSGNDDPNLGRYECVSRVAYGTDLGPGEDWVEIKSAGRITVYMTDDEYNGKYTIDGDKITITQAGDTFEGTVADGVLIVDFNELICTYVMDGVEPPVVTPTINYQWWEGDWYGWWIMNNTAGEYSDLEDMCWDTCARIELDGNGVGTMDLWDVDNEPGKYFALVDVEIVEGASDVGSLITTGGGMYERDIAYGEWVSDPATGLSTYYENFVVIEGYYADPSDSSSHFDYYIILRPWGTDWEDVRNDAENPNMPYTDMMPPEYDSWYLEHVNGAMPDSFN